MESSLSIVNNTDQTWHCAIGPDQAAVKISETALISEGYEAIELGTVVGGTWVTEAAVATLYEVSPQVILLLARIKYGGTFVSVASALVAFATDKFKADGFIEIRPGQKHTWGGLSLSLWQQGHCKRATPLTPSSGKVGYLHEELYMCPIFSGGTAGSNLDHDIKHWLDKWGTENVVKVVVDGADPNAPVPYPNFMLVNKANGKAVDVDNNKCDSGTNIHLWTNHNPSAASQIFTFGNNNEIVHVACQKALDVSFAKCDSGINIKLEYLNHHDAQKWEFYSTGGDNTFEIVNPMCNKALDVNGACSGDGTNIQLWDRNQGDAQVWSIKVLNYRCTWRTYRLDGKIPPIQ